MARLRACPAGRVSLAPRGWVRQLAHCSLLVLCVSNCVLPSPAGRCGVLLAGAAAHAAGSGPQRPLLPDRCGNCSNCTRAEISSSAAAQACSSSSRTVYLQAAQACAVSAAVRSWCFVPCATKLRQLPGILSSGLFLHMQITTLVSIPMACCTSASLPSPAAFHARLTRQVGLPAWGLPVPCLPAVGRYCHKRATGVMLPESSWDATMLVFLSK